MEDLFTKEPDSKSIDNKSKLDNGPKKDQVIKPVFKGPFKIKVEVLKEGKFRLDGTLYDLKSGEFFDGSKLTPKKFSLLTEQKYIRVINQ